MIQIIPKNSERESKSTKYTDIQSDYVGNLAKIKLLKACIMVYEIRYPFIIPTLVDRYVGAVEDHWGNRVATGFYLLSHWLNVLLRVVSQF